MDKGTGGGRALDVVLTRRRVDLIEEGFDVAGPVSSWQTTTPAPQGAGVAGGAGGVLSGSAVAYVGDFFPAGEGGLDSPVGLTFGPDDGKQFEGRLLRIFDAGHQFEDLTIRWLQAAGFEDVRLANRNAWYRQQVRMRVFTELAHDTDRNQGNLLISRAPDNPRVFAVDNGLAFGSVTSDRGATWRQLQVRKLPAATVARLRSITEEDLRRTLETVAQFEVGEDGLMRPVPPTENLSPGRGVRRSDGVIQLGLTEREIRELWRRLEDLIEDVDEGRYTLF